jgi:hypothetical protein
LRKIIGGSQEKGEINTKDIVLTMAGKINYEVKLVFYNTDDEI